MDAHVRRGSTPQISREQDGAEHGRLWNRVKDDALVIAWVECPS